MNLLYNNPHEADIVCSTEAVAKIRGANLNFMRLIAFSSHSFRSFICSYIHLYTHICSIYIQDIPKHISSWKKKVSHQ